MNASLRSLVVGGWFTAVRCLSRGSGSYVIGSSMAHFSLGAGIAPLAGFYGGAFGAVSVGLISFLMSFCLHGSCSWASAALCVPGVVGGLFLTMRSRVTQSLLILGCMALFWVHPVGQQAFLYPLLWLVPLVVTVRGAQSIFARALASTFVVHAVGACLWLYLMPMPAVVWHSMMPLVVVERLVNALGMTAVVLGLEKVSCWVRSHQYVCALFRKA